MLVGHSAISMAMKGTAKNVSLGWLFISVQFVDILFIFFAFAGWERYQFMPNGDFTYFALRNNSLNQIK